ncbi:MAG: Uma2 family endonuclease [Gemmataceae bacterium]|nr:Uma2 family endonuclease [Gemmataceae bacterium]
MSTATITPPPIAPAAPTTPATPAARMTAEEFGLKYSGQHVEYVDGQVKEVPMPGGKHGRACYKFTLALGNFIEANDLGYVFTNDTFVKVPTRDDPDRVYGPDVCFVRYDRLAKDAEVPTGVLTVVPNLVVEVRSPSDTWGDVFSKLGDYLNAGVPVVVVIDFGTQTASAYRSDPANPQEIFRATDTLALPDVLPNFAVPVAGLFA